MLYSPKLSKADRTMTTTDWKNQLYFGDNLEHPAQSTIISPDASVDLIYLDPPFNSNANYNVLFQEKSGQQSAAPDHRLRGHLALGPSMYPELAYERCRRPTPLCKLPDLLQAMRSFLRATTT